MYGVACSFRDLIVCSSYLNEYAFLLTIFMPDTGHARVNHICFHMPIHDYTSNIGS